jgi:hypothetical protein
MKRLHAFALRIIVTISRRYHNKTMQLINHNRHGIRIVIHQTGQASVVDVQVLCPLAMPQRGFEGV